MASDGSLDDRGLNVKTTISYINTALNGGCFLCAALWQFHEVFVINTLLFLTLCCTDRI